VVLVSYELLMSESFRAFHALASNREQLAQLRSVFSALVQGEPKLRALLSPSQERRVDTQVFRLSLGSFFRLLGRGDPAESAARLLLAAGLPVTDCCSTDAEFEALLRTRLALVSEPWARVIVDSPRTHLFHDYRRDSRAKFSQNSFGLYRRALASGQGSARSRPSTHFMLAGCSGFRWIVGSQPFDTLSELRPCMDLLDFKVGRLPWTCVLEAGSGALSKGGAEYALMPEATRDLRTKLFMWASLMSLCRVCALKDRLRGPRVESVALQPVTQPASERLGIRVHVKPGEARPVRFCCCCFEPTGQSTGCGHSMCAACLDAWLDQGGRTCPVCRQVVSSVSVSSDRPVGSVKLTALAALGFVSPCIVTSQDEGLLEAKDSDAVRYVKLEDLLEDGPRLAARTLVLMEPVADPTIVSRLLARACPYDAPEPVRVVVMFVRSSAEERAASVCHSLLLAFLQQ
jgi:hypothetical protein